MFFIKLNPPLLTATCLIWERVKVKLIQIPMLYELRSVTSTRQKPKQNIKMFFCSKKKLTETLITASGRGITVDQPVSILFSCLVRDFRKALEMRICWWLPVFPFLSCSGGVGNACESTREIPNCTSVWTEASSAAFRGLLSVRFCNYRRSPLWIVF